VVRRSDEGEAQCRRWTFYEAILLDSLLDSEGRDKRPEENA